MNMENSYKDFYYYQLAQKRREQRERLEAKEDLVEEQKEREWDSWLE